MKEGFPVAQPVKNPTAMQETPVLGWEDPLEKGQAIHSQYSWAFLVASDGKESACNVGDLGLNPGLGRSLGGGHGNPLQYSCLENPHGYSNLVGYSPWGGKALDMTE